MNKNKGFTKSIAFTLVMAMLFATLSFGGMAGLPGVGGVEVYGATTPTPVEAQAATLNGYYLTERNGILTDWEEVAAVKASGGNLEDFVLPDYNTGTPSTTVLYALIRGDITSAGIAASQLVASEQLIKGEDAFKHSLNIIAVEAYNRTVDVTAKIEYSTTAAVVDLLNFRTNGVFLDPYNELPGGDMVGLSMVALSMFNGDIGTVDAAIEQCKLQVRDAQVQNGAFVGAWGFGEPDANTTAIIIYGIMAADPNNISTYTTGGGMSPIDGLLSFYVPEGGFWYGENPVANGYATKQSTLALADIIRGSSFLANLTAGGIHYTRAEGQVIDENGLFHNKIITIGNDKDFSNAIQKILSTSTAIDLSNYNIYENGELINDISTEIVEEGSNFLAINKKFDKVAYFVENINGPIDVYRKTVPFEASIDLILVQKNLSSGAITFLSGKPLEYGTALVSNFGKTDDDGNVNITPVESGVEYQIQPKRTTTTYDPVIITTHIEDDTAILPALIKMNSGDPQTISVSVRIEGPSSNIAYDPSFTVARDDGSRITVYDAVTQVLTDSNINYEASSKYIYSIDGISAGSYGTSQFWDGWSYTIDEPHYLDGSRSLSGMGTQFINDGDQIVVYYGNDNASTVYPLLTTTLQNDGSLKIQSKHYALNWDTWATDLVPTKELNVYWGYTSGTALTYEAITNDEGIAIIPAEYATIGNHPLQIGKGAPNLPDVVRLAPNYVIGISSSGASSGTGPIAAPDQVYLTVVGPYGTLKRETPFAWYNGISPLTLLRSSGLSIKLDGAGAYVEEVEGYGEFDLGTNAGWLYSVNGITPPTTAAGSYKLNKNDVVRWYYTKDFTKDASSSSWVTENQAGAVQDGLVSITTDVKAVTGSDGTAKATVSTTQLDTAVTDALKAAAASKDGAKPAVTIAIEADSKAQGVETVIPKAAFANLVNKGIQQMTIASPLGNITLDLETLKDIVKGGAGDISLSIKKSEESQGRPVIRLEINNGGKAVGTFSKPITITVPYSPAASENEQGIAVFHLDENGQWKNIKASKYDGKNKTIVFRTNHFSDFVIAYSHKTFGDIQGHWAQTPIEYLASRRIIQGMTEESFAPNGTITRAQFVTLLAGMAGADLNQYSLSRFNDVKDNAWYKGAVVWAAENGIVQGLQAADGSFWFNPNQNISRQDMAVVMMRYLAWAKEPAKETTKAIAFKDGSAIASYAKESVATMQKAGLINGRTTPDNQTVFDPAGKLTRAEAAQILTNQLYQQF